MPKPMAPRPTKPMVGLDMMILSEEWIFSNDSIVFGGIIMDLMGFKAVNKERQSNRESLSWPTALSGMFVGVRSCADVSFCIVTFG